MKLWYDSIQRLNIVVGILAAAILFALGLSSTETFRRRYYWWFYKIHITGSFLLLPLLFFHVSHCRIYLFESAMILMANAIFRTYKGKK